MSRTARNTGQWFLLTLLAVALYFCFRIIQPFLMPVFLALVLSALLEPIYEVLARKFKGRESLAALAVCLGLTAAILVPLVFAQIIPDWP